MKKTVLSLVGVCALFLQAAPADAGGSRTPEEIAKALVIPQKFWWDLKDFEIGWSAGKGADAAASGRNFHFLGGKGQEGSGAAVPKFNLTPAPLALFGLPDSSAAGGASSVFFLSGQAVWNRQSIQTAKECYDLLVSDIEAGKADDIRLSFTVTFYNLDADPVQILPRSIPVLVSNQRIADAAPETGDSPVTVPAKSEAGADVVFRASLQGTQAPKLVDLLKRSGPTLPLRKCGMKISSVDGARDIMREISEVEEKTCPVSVSTSCGSALWRVLSFNPEEEEPTTVAQALEAVNAVVGVNAAKEKFFVSDESKIRRIADFKDDGRWFAYLSDQKTNSDSTLLKSNLEPLRFELLARSDIKADSEHFKTLPDKEVADFCLPMLPKWREGAELGWPESQYLLGRCYGGAWGLTQDYAEAAKWYRRAAMQGNVDAECWLGFSYFEGKGVEQNYAEAAKWYRRAAEKGNPYGQFKLGYCYLTGMGALQNNDEALKWLSKAGVMGNMAAQALLGDNYLSGKIIPQDFAEAVKWLGKAAEQGDAPSQFKLGTCLFEGKGAPKNQDEAVKWITKSAVQGDALAQRFLADFYYDQEDGRNLPDAVRWYRKAAEQGNVPAQYRLGLCCYDGTGTGQDFAEAFKWFKKAAEKGHPDAQFKVGLCYYYAKGIPQDYSESWVWVKKAADQGNTEAKKFFEQFTSHKDDK